MFPVLSPNAALFAENDGTEEVYLLFLPDGADNDYEYLSSDEYATLYHADGTHPLPDSSFTQRMFDIGVLTNHRLVWQNHWGYFILVSFPRRIHPLLSRFCVSFNRMLPFAGAMCFIFGLFWSRIGSFFFYSHFNLFLFIILTLMGLFFHEAGHYISSVGAGQSPRQLVIKLFLGIIPVGVYVSCDVDSSLSYKEEIQFFLSGVQLQSIYMGLLYLMASLSLDSCFLAAGAKANEIIILLTMAPAFQQLDGERCVSTLLHVESISCVSVSLLIHNKTARQCLAFFGTAKRKKILIGCSMVYLSWGAYLAYLIYIFSKLL